MKLDELKINVPKLKPRNSTYQTLLAKKNAAGAHKDKKDLLKRGQLKHKNQMHEAVNSDEKFVSKAEVKAELKKLGLKNVSVEAKHSFGTKPIAYKQNGKLIAGIHLSSHSPMNVTSAARDRVTKKLKEIEQKLKDFGLSVTSKTHSSLTITANADTKKAFSISAFVNSYPTYDRSMNYDNDYLSDWLIFNFDNKQ